MERGILLNKVFFPMEFSCLAFWGSFVDKGPGRECLPENKEGCRTESAPEKCPSQISKVGAVAAAAAAALLTAVWTVEMVERGGAY